MRHLSPAYALLNLGDMGGLFTSGLCLDLIGVTIMILTLGFLASRP